MTAPQPTQQQLTQAIRTVVREELQQLLTERSPSPGEDSQFLTTPQVSELTGIAENTLRRWRSDQAPDAPPYVRLGRAVRYYRPDLMEWLLNRAA